MDRNLSLRAHIFTTFFLLALCLPIPDARAQTDCRTDREAIVTLKPPKPTAPFDWDVKYTAKDAAVQFVAGVPLPGGTVLAMGVATGKDKASQRIVLAELDHRGRAVHEAPYPAKNGEVPVRMIAAGDSMVVLSTIRAGEKKDRRQVRIAWYGKTGKFIRETILQDDAYDYEAGAMTEDAAGDGFMVAVNAARHERADDRRGVLARFDNNGAKLWQRSYSSGSARGIDGVTPAADKSWLATGHIRMDDGHRAGWAMKVGPDGAVMWQQTYPRGAQAGLKQGVAVPAGFVVSGETMPLGGGPQALWIMALDGQGRTLWQRYILAQDFAFSGAGLLTEEDGRIFAAVNATAASGDKNRHHIRLLAFSPRGDLMNDRTYSDGTGARAGSMIRGGGNQRIVTATIDSDDRPANSAAPGISVQKGWVFIVPGPVSWTDSCAKP